MNHFSEQLFYGLIIEAFCVLLSIIFNEDKKKTLTILSIGTIIAGIIAFFPFTNSDNSINQKTPDSQINSAEYATPIKLVSDTPTKKSSIIPLITEAIIPTSTPLALDESNEWNGNLSVRMPTLNEIRNENPISLWDDNLIDVHDMTKPGTDKYSGIANHSEEYLFPVYWCSTSHDLLYKNKESITTNFYIDNQKVPEKYIFDFDYDTNNGWSCNYHAIVIRNWIKDTQYSLKIERILSKNINDGNTNYPSGSYSYIFQITTY